MITAGTPNLATQTENRASAQALAVVEAIGIAHLPGGAVNNGEKMGETIGGWQRTHEVHMDVAEPLSRDRNDVDWRLNMPDHLGALAVEARPGPNPNVCVHGGPEETCRNQPP